MSNLKKQSRWIILLILIGATVFYGFANIFADSEILIDDNFDKAAVGSKPEGYIIEETGGLVEIADLPGSGNHSLALMDPGSSVIKVSKKFAPQTKVVTVEVAFMQRDFGSTAKPIRLLDKDGQGIAVQIETRKPNLFGYKNADGTFNEFAQYEKNEWSVLTIIADVAAQKADVYCDGELKLSQVPFLGKVENIGMIDSFTPGSSGKGHYLDNIKVVAGIAKPTAVVAKKEAAPAGETAAPTQSGSQVITDFKVYSPTPQAQIQTNLQVGQKIYVDRAYYIAKLPDAYVGMDWLQLSCDSKNYFKDPLLSFKLTADAEVFIAYDDRVMKKPDWFTGWEDTGDDMVDTEAAPVTFSIYKKKFPAGSEIVLGHNGQSSGCVQYTVFIKGPNWNPDAAKNAAPIDVPVEVTWKTILAMKPEWYGSADAIRVGDNVLAYQYDTGGWYKNIDMAAELRPEDLRLIQANKKNRTESTIDNDATTTQIRYLAKVYTATKLERFKEGFLKGMKFIFDAQYDNGGWPQYYPEQTEDYYKRITYNDGAMNQVLMLLADVAKGENEFAFVAPEMRERAKKAFDKGIECILKTQIRVNGKLTAWGAQYDEKTLQPAEARAYEKVSIASLESAGIVKLLMSIENPSPEIINAIQSAVEWLDSVKLLGIEVRRKEDPTLDKGYDMVVNQNPSAAPIWARFYEIGTNRPIFCGRDGIVKYSLAEIEHERRIGYSWYNYAPGNIIVNEYPKWQQKWAPDHNVLKK